MQETATKRISLWFLVNNNTLIWHFKFPLFHRHKNSEVTRIIFGPRIFLLGHDSKWPPKDVVFARFDFTNNMKERVVSQFVLANLVYKSVLNPYQTNHFWGYMHFKLISQSHSHAQ